MGLDFRVDSCKCTDGSGNRAGGDILAGKFEAFFCAGKFRIGLRHLETKGRRLGMNAVATPNTDAVLVFNGPAFEGFQQLIKVIEQNVRRASQLDTKAGVENI